VKNIKLKKYQKDQVIKCPDPGLAIKGSQHAALPAKNILGIKPTSKDFGLIKDGENAINQLFQRIVKRTAGREKLLARPSSEPVYAFLPGVG
jgi:hypothetical protein